MHLRIKCYLSILKRSLHWAGSRKGSRFKKITNIDRALEYFDDVYPKIYGEEWKKYIRESLLNKNKYAALINNFSENGEAVNEIENMGAFEIGSFYTKRVAKFNDQNNFDDKSDKNKFIILSEPKITKLRPSLIELTPDEMADLEANASIDRYPEQYKEKAIAAGIFSGTQTESIMDQSRKLDTSMIRDSDISSVFSHIPSSKMKGLEDWIEETDVFIGSDQPDNEIGVRHIRLKEPIQWPKQLKAYTFVMGDTESEFTQPIERKNLELYPYFLLNAASLMPVLALDLQLGDKVLDLCAAPGGKTLAILQTCLPETLVCNDVSHSRIERIYNVLDLYIPKQLSVRNTVEVTNFNGCVLMYENYFDKVLVDVPCLGDRYSVAESDNSIFKKSRLKERMRMPELQSQLLVNAIKAVKPGGSVVYSTCTLSPLQNDGTVQLALTRIWKETKMECTVVDLGETVKHLGSIFKFGHNLGLRYGHIIIPHPERNFGPMYFCKIIRSR